MPPDAPAWFAGLLLVVAAVAGATASVIGFGIGSLLTPLLATRLETDLAIAAVALRTSRAACCADGGCARPWTAESCSASAVLVDVARTPIYLIAAGDRLLDLAGRIALAAGGVLLGTLVGERLLFGLSPARFRVVVSAAVGALGLWFPVGGA